MQTQRDHVHAYQFMMGRMSSALVLGDPASAEVPARRAVTGIYIGLALAVLIAIGFGVYGWLVPGGNESWRAQGAIVVEKESGTRFVNVGGVLYPTLNHTSAKLLQGPNGDPKAKLLSKASLAEAPRGAPVGIPGAPQLLPPVQDLVGSQWLACLPGDLESGLNLDFDPETPAAPLPQDRYVLVQSEAGAQYLLWGGSKHQVADPVVLAALGLANVQPVPAPEPWLAALPDGPALAPARIEGSGAPGPAIGGSPYLVGQVFEQRASNGDVQRFVLRGDGLAPVSRTEFVLLAAVPGAPEPAQLDAAAVAAAPRSADRSLTSRLPELSEARWQDHGADQICLQQVPAGTRIASEIVFAAPAAGINLPPGKGVVVGAVPLPAGQRTPDRYLIAEGEKYLLPDDDSMRALGYGGAPVQPMAGDLLDTVPSGPALSRAAAGATTKG